MCCVRPGVFDAKASRPCWVRVLIAVLLPALDRPTKAISGSSLIGNCTSWLAVVGNRAAGAHPNASFSGDGAAEAVAKGLPFDKVERAAAVDLISCFMARPSI